MTQPPPPASSPRPEPYPGPAANGRDLGRIAFIIAVVALVVGAALHIFGVFLPMTMAATGAGYMQIAGLLGAFNFLHAAISLTALVIGALGAQRRQSLLLAGIAIGVGAAGVVGGIVSLAIVPLAGFLL